MINRLTFQGKMKELVGLIKDLPYIFQFFEEAAECEQWMSRQSDSISSRYTDENQSIDTLNQLLKELQELSALISDYERRVSSLTIRSREIIPLKQRGQPVFSELKCRCLCIYKQPPVSLSAMVQKSTHEDYWAAA